MTPCVCEIGKVACPENVTTTSFFVDEEYLRRSAFSTSKIGPDYFLFREYSSGIIQIEINFASLSAEEVNDE